MSTAQQAPDWSAWSREAVKIMLARNAEWPRQFGLQSPSQYHWDLDSATLTLEGTMGPVLATVLPGGHDQR